MEEEEDDDKVVMVRVRAGGVVVVVGLRVNAGVKACAVVVTMGRRLQRKRRRMIAEQPAWTWAGWSDWRTAKMERTYTCMAGWLAVWGPVRVGVGL